MFRAIRAAFFGSGGSRSDGPMRSDQREHNHGAEFVQWGKIPIPYHDASNHFLAVGTTGSGKTSMLRLLMQSVLPLVGTGDFRALVYDAKLDAMPVLSNIAEEERIINLNPFDDRGAAWDISKDLDEPRLIFEIASTLVPHVPDTTQFFRNATVHCLYGVALSYYLSDFQYGLGDLIRPLLRPSHLVQILSAHDETRAIAEQYFRDEKLVSNLLASFAVSVIPYEHVAACWEFAEKKISLREWAKGEFILVLGNTEVSRAALDNINRCLFKVAAVLTIDKPDSRTSSTWFFIDEASEAGKLDSLVSLAKKGRSKGAKLALAFQSISGLRDPKLYGKEGADELLGQFGTKFIGRLECVTTAEHFSQLIGDERYISISNSYTSGQQSSSTTSYSAQVRKAIMPSHLMNIRPCNIENGLTGYCISPRFGTYKTRINGQSLFRDMLVPASDDVPHFVPRPARQQILSPWTKEEALAFGVDIDKPFRLQLETQLGTAKPKPERKRKQAKATEAPDALEF